MRWQFEVVDSGSTSCRFVLRMSNEKILLESDRFDRTDDCVLAISELKVSVGNRRSFVRMRSLDGHLYLAVVNGRNEVLATSRSFDSRAAAAAASMAIQSVALTAPIVDTRGTPPQTVATAGL